VGGQRPDEADLRYYNLFDLGEEQWPPREVTPHQWAEALVLRDELIRIRTGSAAPHPEALEPERLLELRMTASDGYW